MSASRAEGESRREREQRARRKERRIVGGLIGVLAVAGVVVLVGLYVTQYRAPRAHVLRVGDRDYNASDVARRAVYTLRVSGIGPTEISQLPDNELERLLGRLVDDTLLRIQDAEVVLQRAPAFVGNLSDEELDAELHERLGFADSDDEQGFADALATLLRAMDLPRDEYNEVVRGEVLVQRLRDQFTVDIGEEAEQLLLSRIRLADEVTAEEVRELALGDADFAELATERILEAPLAESSGDLGWLLFAELSADVQSALGDLEAGAVSAVVADGAFFDVYLVAERDAARTLEEEQIEMFVALRLRDWLESERPAVEVAIDLSSGEKRWMSDRIRSVGSRAPVTSAGGGS